MRTVVLIIFSLTAVDCSAQKEDVFRIEKEPTHKSFQKVYKLDIFSGVDTLEVNSGRLFDFTNVKGTYDSISTFNMQYRLMGNYILLTPGKFEGTGIFKLFKKDSKGEMMLFFIKNFKLVKLRSFY